MKLKNEKLGLFVRGGVFFSHLFNCYFKYL
jgi:hypothetical protein